MKEEGTREPQNADIALDADVRMRELRFEEAPDPEAPDPEARLRGITRGNSVWGSGRENLPQKSREDVTYRDASVRLRIASGLAGGEPDLWKRRKEEREE